MYKECNLGDNDLTYAQFEHNFKAGLQDFYRHPMNYKLDAFQIFGNLYYVGDKKVCMHLINTGDGLILFDSGYGNTLHMILASIRSLGFHPEHLRYIIHSHGHYDHFGSGEDLRRLYSCKIFMSKADTDMLRKSPQSALIEWGPHPYDQICWPDVELEDDEVISLGNTKIRCVLTPGHTIGTMTFFFDVTDGDNTLRVGYFGGAGFMTMYQDYCKQFNLPLDLNKKMRESIKRVWPEHVDIMLGNHPSQNCTLEKRAWMIEHPDTNPFINPKAWHIFLKTLEERSINFEKKGF